MNDTESPVRLGTQNLTVAELRSRNAVLFWATVLSSILLVSALLGLVLDPRTVGGESVWFKPMRYAAAMALFTATLGWLTPRFSVSDRVLRLVSWVVGFAVVFELTAIAGQAARGMDAHFNHATGFDALVYLLMGIVIASMTLTVGALFVVGALKGFNAHPAFALGITLGGILFVVGSFEGGIMSALGTNTVGSGYTLPVVGWTLVGDFRVAHFVGLHSLQALPLIGYLAAVGERRGHITHPRRLVWVAGITYTAVLVGVFALALYPLLG